MHCTDGTGTRFHALFLADDTCHIRSAPATVEGTDFRPGLTKDRIFCRNGQIAHHVQHVTATDGVTCYRSDHWLRTGTDLTLEIQHVQVMGAACVFVAAVVATNLLVTAGAKCFIARTGQNDGADMVVVASIRHGLNHFFNRLRAESVAHLWAVDGDFSDTVCRFMVENIFKSAEQSCHSIGAYSSCSLGYSIVRFLLKKWGKKVTHLSNKLVRIRAMCVMTGACNRSHRQIRFGGKLLKLSVTLTA